MGLLGQVPLWYRAFVVNNHECPFFSWGFRRSEVFFCGSKNFSCEHFVVLKLSLLQVFSYWIFKFSEYKIFIC